MQESPPVVATPAKGELAKRRISVRAAALYCGRHPTYLGTVLNGYVRPSAELARQLGELLGMDAAELFPSLGTRRPPYPGDDLVGVVEQRNEQAGDDSRGMRR